MPVLPCDVQTTVLYPFNGDSLESTLGRMALKEIIPLPCPLCHMLLSHAMPAMLGVQCRALSVSLPRPALPFSIQGW